jgi:hypothetical protein
MQILRNDARIGNRPHDSHLTECQKYLDNCQIKGLRNYITRYAKFDKAPKKPAKKVDDEEKKAYRDYCLARMVYEANFPLEAIDSEGFRSFICVLNPEYELPSRDDIVAMKDLVLERAADEDQTYMNGRIHEMKYKLWRKDLKNHIPVVVDDE